MRLPHSPFAFLALAGLLLVPGLGSAAPSAPSFDLLEFQVEGNSVLPAIEVERAVYPQLGPARGVAHVEQAREALEKAYHDAGFLTVIVDIPEQKIVGGLVRLRVTEGRVERLRVAGNRYTSRSVIRAEAPSLAAGEVPNFGVVQQELGQAQRPDRKLTPLLRPGRTPGTVEVELQVEDALPLHGSVEANNKQSPDTSAGRLEASVRYDNLWQRGHGIGLSVQTSPRERSEVEVWTGTYSAPLGSGTLAAYAVRSGSDISTASASSVLGKGNTLGARYIRPLPARGDAYQSLTAGVDYKDFKETTNLIGADTTTRPLRYVLFMAQYSALRPDAAGQWQFNAGAAWSVRHLMDRKVLCDDGRMRDQFDCKRSGAHSSFAVLRADVQRSQTLVGGWNLLARADLQLAGQPLVSNEQFSAGGVDSVRGYLDGERQGDHGLRARVEVRTPALWPALGLDAHLVGFADAAWLRVVEPLPQQQDDFRLAGLGLGLRLSDGKRMRLAADAARALSNGADAPGGGFRTEKKDLRLHLRLSWEF